MERDWVSKKSNCDMHDLTLNITLNTFLYFCFWLGCGVRVTISTDHTQFSFDTPYRCLSQWSIRAKALQRLHVPPGTVRWSPCSGCRWEKRREDCERTDKILTNYWMIVGHGCAIETPCACGILIVRDWSMISAYIWCSNLVFSKVTWSPRWTSSIVEIQSR